MDEWIKLTELNIAYWVAGGFAILEFFRWIYTFGEWLVSKFGIETKRTKSQKEFNNRLTNVENDIVEIKETAKTNVQMFLDHEETVVEKFDNISNKVIERLNTLDAKIDEQQANLEDKLETIDKAGKKRDCTLMRDRLIQGYKYFSQNKDENGVVYISMTDFENLNSMFQEYFAAGGNGAVKHIYDGDFQKFKIDSATFDSVANNQ